MQQLHLGDVQPLTGLFYRGLRLQPLDEGGDRHLRGHKPAPDIRDPTIANPDHRDGMSLRIGAPAWLEGTEAQMDRGPRTLNSPGMLAPGSACSAARRLSTRISACSSSTG